MIIGVFELFFNGGNRFRTVKISLGTQNPKVCNYNPYFPKFLLNFDKNHAEISTIFQESLWTQ